MENNIPTSSTSNSNKKLKGKVTIVTGGASGIGEATALLFAEHGARAVVIADIQDDKGQILAERIGLDRSTYIHCDVTDEGQVESLVQTTCRLYGSLDVMFCNAGTISQSSQTIRDFDLEAYDRLFAVNVRGMAACVKYAARPMVDQGVKGSIICTASMAAGFGGDRGTDYIMSKDAVLGLMRCASVQLGASGIRVNCVSPGAIATPLACGMFGMSPEEFEETFESKKWLKGALKTTHVADAVLFLACDDSAFVTGHNLAVTGGFKGQ